MSLIELPKWARRQFNEHGTNIIDGPSNRRMMPPLKLPPDLERDLSRALDEPFGAPVRTAQIISDQIARLSDELERARKLVADAETKRAELVAELTKAVDEEIAAKKATHDADVAELESLRPTQS